MVDSIPQVLKEGPLWHYKHKIFGHNWTPAYCVLHVDSFFVCYQHQGDTEPAGTVLLRSVAPLICIGGYTDRIPNRPKLPDNLSVANLIAIGNEDKSINWFAAETSDEFNAWWAAIVSTLPPPPSQQSVGPQNPSPYTISTPPAEQHIPASTATVVIPASPSQPTAHSTTVVVAGGRPIYDDSFNTGLILGSSIGHPWGWGWGFDPCCDAWRFDTDTSTIVNQTRVINDYTNVSDGVEGDATVDDSGKDVVDFDEGNDGDTYDAPDDSAPDTVDAGDGGGTYDAGGDAD